MIGLGSDKNNLCIRGRNEQPFQSQPIKKNKRAKRTFDMFRKIVPGFIAQIFAKQYICHANRTFCTSVDRGHSKYKKMLVGRGLIVSGIIHMVWELTPKCCRLKVAESICLSKNRMCFRMSREQWPLTDQQWFFPSQWLNIRKRLHCFCTATTFTAQC